MARPWVKPGYISQQPYSPPCIVGAIDRILGLDPLTDNVATCNPMTYMFTSADYTPFTADTSGVTTFPFTPQPGTPPTSDPEHGIYSFTLPDAIDPELAPLSRRGLRVQIGREMGGALHASAHRYATRDIPGRHQQQRREAG
jgi:hypothetical protein